MKLLNHIVSAVAFLACFSCASMSSASYDDAVAYFDQGEYGKASSMFITLAKNGDDRAQYYLGLMSDYGLGEQRNASRAVYWYEKAASVNNVKAQHNLGVLNIIGTHGEPDYDTAIHWLNLSAAQGYTPSFHELGWTYFKRGNDLSDLCMAIHWYDKSNDAATTPEPIKDLRVKLKGKCEQNNE